MNSLALKEVGNQTPGMEVESQVRRRLPGAVVNPGRNSRTLGPETLQAHQIFSLPIDITSGGWTVFMPPASSLTGEERWSAKTAGGLACFQ